MTTVAPKAEIEPLFSLAVYGKGPERALDALAALNVCVSANTLRCAPRSLIVPFARPTGASMYEADALTWRFYDTHASCLDRALIQKTYGVLLAHALYEDFMKPYYEDETLRTRQFHTDPIEQVLAALTALRRALRAKAAMN
jgi:hypothetical protein